MDAKFLHKPTWNGKIYWPNTIFITATPLATVILLPYILITRGFTWWDFSIFSFMIFTTGVALTAGYHRMISHQAFETPAWVRAVFLFFGAGCIENSALKWASDHRYHHRFVDKDGDPYNINRGFFYAHMGWIFFGDPPGRTLDNSPDLLADPLVALQHKYYTPLCAFVGFGLPTLLGVAAGRPLEGFFWGGLFRVVLTHHLSFLINSACHMFGSRPYSTKVTARDCWWLAVLTNGEGWHNFHHTFGSDYRNGLRWYQWDLSKWVILTLNGLGLAYNLKRTPESIILKARLETSFEEFRSHSHGREIPDQLLRARAALDEKIQEFQLRLREFQAWKENKIEEHKRSRRVRLKLWKRRLRIERRSLELAVAELGMRLQALELA